jgi:hypothetical protein
MRRAASAVALGFAPHSGWGALVGVGAAGGALRLLLRERLVLADERDPESKQPYHAVEGLPVPEAARRLKAYTAGAERMAATALRTIVAALAKDGHSVVGLGILDSAGRQGRSLAEVLASHALIHTADGNHFRDAVAAAATGCRVPVARVRAKDLEAQAEAAIGRPLETLRQALKELGREAGPPWGADQKAAALLAWRVLAGGAKE